MNFGIKFPWLHLFVYSAVFQSIKVQSIKRHLWMVCKNLCLHEAGLHSRSFQIHILKDIPPLHKSHTLGSKHF